MNLNFISERKSFDNWKGKNNGKGTMGKEKKIVLAVMQQKTLLFTLVKNLGNLETSPAKSTVSL